MKKGEVVFRPNYAFPNGITSDKLLIVLNDPTPNEPYLFLLTTSKQKRREKTPGCHSSSGYYVIPKNIDFFTEPATWILFNTVTECTFEDEAKELKAGNFKTMCCLKDTTMRAIINCIKQSGWLTFYQTSLLK